MNPLHWLRRLSARTHLALGLAALTAGMLCMATLFGLLPDGEAQTRQHRAALAETIAITASSLLDEEQPETLRETLSFFRDRNPGLESIGVRAQDGRLLIDVARHSEQWIAGPRSRSTDSEVFVPVWQGSQPWGQVELRFTPLRAAGWRGYLQDPTLKLAAFVFAVCLPMFALYLRRMLRELDPSRAVPQRVRAAYDTLTEGLLVLDRDGAIVLANKSTAVMLAVDDSALVGRSPNHFEWSDAEGRPLEGQGLPWMAALASREQQRDVHLKVRNAAGAAYSLRANCSPIVAGKDQLQALVISFQDVTELEQRGEALREAKEQADAANEAKSRFLANMSHEIRTPMNAILGFTEVLRRGGARESEQTNKHLDIIHAGGRHLLMLINDILDLSKVEAGRVDVERRPYAPHSVAQEVVQTLAERAADKGLRLEFEWPKVLPATIDGDEVRLRQILTNLVGNAIKFTEQGQITLRLWLLRSGNKARYCFDVQDSGIGIAADKLQSVFEPFVQAESSTTRRFGGTGLGLTISRGFARAMGGDITVSSEPGRGTTFTLWLDASGLADADLVDTASLRAPAPVAHAAAHVRWQFPPKRVLVVDDGAENRQLVRVLLQEVGLRVDEAENGQVALDCVAAQHYDIVLMDMQMPVMDGQTATRLLRARGLTLPVIALTANAMKGFERELADAGFSGFQTKPIDIDALLLDLAQRLGAQPAVAASAADKPAPHAVALPRPERTPLVSRLAQHAKLGRIVERFVAQLPDKLSQMQRATDGGDFSELAALAHWLKGAGGSMGFEPLFEPSKALEDAALACDRTAAAAAMTCLQALAERIALGSAQSTNTTAEVA